MFQGSAPKKKMRPPFNDTDQMLKDGFASSILGSAAMAARILVSTDRMSVGWIIRWASAAIITSAFVGIVAQDYIQNKGALYGAIGISGAAAPELIDFIIKYVKARGAREVSNVTKKRSRRQ